MTLFRDMVQKEVERLLAAAVKDEAERTVAAILAGKSVPAVPLPTARFAIPLPPIVPAPAPPLLYPIAPPPPPPHAIDSYLRAVEGRRQPKFTQKCPAGSFIALTQKAPPIGWDTSPIAAARAYHIVRQLLQAGPASRMHVSAVLQEEMKLAKNNASSVVSQMMNRGLIVTHHSRA